MVGQVADALVTFFPFFNNDSLDHKHIARATAPSTDPSGCPTVNRAMLSHTILCHAFASLTL